MYLFSSKGNIVKFRFAVFVVLYFQSLNIKGDFLKPCLPDDEVRYVCRPDTNISCYDQEMVNLKLTKLDGIKVCKNDLILACEMTEK